VLRDYLELEIRREAMMLSEACAVTETSGRVTPDLGSEFGGVPPQDYARATAGLHHRFLQ